MKIINNNMTSYEPEEEDKYPMQVICENCGSELWIDKEDVYVGPYGCKIVKCPCCGGETDTYAEPFVLTEDNIKYPEHFASMSDNALELPDEDIQKYVDRCVGAVGKDNPYAFSGTGDTMVFAFDLADEVCVYVCKKYEETSIYKE